MTASDKCSGFKSPEPGDSWSRPLRCGRPVKDDGLCAHHLAGKKRRLQHDQKQRDQRTANEVNHDRANQAAARLAGWGTQAQVYFDWRTGKYDGRVLVDPEKLIEKLRGKSDG